MYSQGKSNKSISVVIPNYNGKNLLEQNIPNVYKALQSSYIENYEIIVSDDASTDASLLFLKENYPEIILVENKLNKGFSGNSNAGIKAATKELVLILNSDIQLTENYFIPLLPYFEKTDTFGVMGRIIDFDSEKIQDAAKFPAYSFGTIVSTKNYIPEGRSSSFSLFLSGANALVDRKKLLRLDGFNEHFNPYYSEDVDLGLRAWRMGYKLHYNHEAYCKHPLSSTIKKEPSKKVKIVTKRNKMYLHYLHLNGIENLFFVSKLSLKALGRLFVLDMDYLKSYFQFLRSIDSLNKSKLEFRKLQMEENCNWELKDLQHFILKDIGDTKIHTF